DSIGITDELYHFGAIGCGGLAGIAEDVGGFFLSSCRESDTRVINNSTVSDYVILIVLCIVVLVGFTATAGYTASGGDFDYRVVIGPWAREILTFSPSAGMVASMAQAPIGFQLHVFFAFVLFAIWPFTRLVHVFSLPLKYLSRRYVVYRNQKPYGKSKVPKRKELN